MQTWVWVVLIIVGASLVVHMLATDYQLHRDLQTKTESLSRWVDRHITRPFLEAQKLVEKRQYVDALSQVARILGAYEMLEKACADSQPTFSELLPNATEVFNQLTEMEDMLLNQLNTFSRLPLS